MTKSFSTLVAALAISASLVAVTASMTGPVSAFTATGDLTRVGPGPDRGLSAGTISRVPPIANGDLGSGRGGDGITDTTPISGTDLGSGRADGEVGGTTSRPER